VPSPEEFHKLKQKIEGIKMRFEDLKDDEKYVFYTGSVRTGLEWKRSIALYPELNFCSNLQPAPHMDLDLDAFTEVKLRKEWKDLINHIGNDPLLDPWIMDLAVNRCKEIQKLLAECK
jgi:hypothetical protein